MKKIFNTTGSYFYSYVPQVLVLGILLFCAYILGGVITGIYNIRKKKWKL